MRLLHVASGGFGDVSFTTSWPRILFEKGFDVDIFLLRYTGNPFHANPYIKKIYDEYRYEKDLPEKLADLTNSYDLVLVHSTQCAGMDNIVKRLTNIEKVFLGGPFVIQGIPLNFSRPELYFTEKELEYVKNKGLCDSFLFYPYSSDQNEKTRNIDFSLIEKCSYEFQGKKLVVVHGGGNTFKHTASTFDADRLKKLEDLGIQVLCEGYNCFQDEWGSPVGKIMALEAQCKASIHGYSGSFCIALGFKKPYIIIVPENRIRNNMFSEYRNTGEVLKRQMGFLKDCSCMDHCTWGIAKNPKDIITMLNRAIDGKAESYE